MNEQQFEEAVLHVENFQAPSADYKIEMRSEKELEELYEHYYDKGEQVSNLYVERDRMSFLVEKEGDVFLYDAYS